MYATDRDHSTVACMRELRISSLYPYKKDKGEFFWKILLTANLMHRNIDLEYGAMVRLSVRQYKTLVVFHDFLADRQADTGA